MCALFSLLLTERGGSVLLIPFQTPFNFGNTYLSLFWYLEFGRTQSAILQWETSNRGVPIQHHGPSRASCCVTYSSNLWQFWLPGLPGTVVLVILIWERCIQQTFWIVHRDYLWLGNYYSCEEIRGGWPKTISNSPTELVWSLQLLLVGWQGQCIILLRRTSHTTGSRLFYLPAFSSRPCPFWSLKRNTIPATCPDVLFGVSHY